MEIRNAVGVWAGSGSGEASFCLISSVLKGVSTQVSMVGASWGRGRGWLAQELGGSYLCQLCFQSFQVDLEGRLGLGSSDRTYQQCDSSSWSDLHLGSCFWRAQLTQGPYLTGPPLASEDPSSSQPPPPQRPCPLHPMPRAHSNSSPQPRAG